LIVAIIAVGAGLAVWKKKIGGGSASDSFNSISREEIELLIGDIAKSNPMAIKRLAGDLEMKKKQLEGLKQLLAFASQAQHDGMADDPANHQELNNIKAEVIAANYDREINKDKGPMPQFGFITDDQVKQFWGEEVQPAAGQDQAQPAQQPAISASEKEARETQFQQFLDAKLTLLKADNPQMADRQITDEEKQQAKEYYAKIHIYQKEYEDKAKSGGLDEQFKKKTELQVKLQQAQFLAKIYSDKIADKAKVTDDEIAQYISAHPELSPDEKRAKAQGILDRAKGGEDFAKLANEFSEDPGNKDAKGEPQGGLYKDVKKGQMVPPFEEAALALQPGQIAPNLVESDYGFHIIKLEKKTESKDAKGNPAETYDVRHILIATTYKDPDNPNGQPVPVKDYVRQKLTTDKEKKIVDDIVAANNVSVPDDYTVPTVTDEQIQEMMKNQQGPMGMPQGGPPPPAKADQKKADTKKSK
jgi:parvulin-like peptidyl-prolyl isomerase